MRSPANSEDKPRRKTKKRAWRLVLLFAVFVVLLIVFALPRFVSSEMGRGIILERIRSSVDGDVDFANLSMSWRKGIEVTDFSFGDKAGNILVRIKRITTKPHYGSILMGSLSFGDTEILEPRVEINLIRPVSRVRQRPQIANAAVKISQPVNLSIKRINMIVKDGSLKVTGWSGGLIEVNGINSKLDILPSSVLFGELRFGGGSCFGFSFGSTEVNVRIENGLMEIEPFSTTVNNGQFNFAGEADFKQKLTLLKTPGVIEILKDVQINEETTRKLLLYLNPIFADAVNMRGVVNFNCEQLAIPLAEATRNGLEVAGTVSITQMRLQASELLGRILAVGGGGVRGQNITISPTKFVLRDGFLRYDDMEMIVGDNPVNFSGVIGLDKSLNMRVTLPYTTKGETVRVGKEVKGERISLPLRGTVDKPELDLGRLLEEQLRRQLNERLGEELEGLFKK